MTIQEEIWQRTQDLIMRGEEKKFQVVAYLGDKDWCEFSTYLDQHTRYMVRDDSYLGRPTMFNGAMVLRVVIENHRNITTMPV